MGTIEEVLNSLVGGGNVDLIYVINLRPRGNREGGGGDGGGSDGGDKRRRHLKHVQLAPISETVLMLRLITKV